MSGGYTELEKKKKLLSRDFLYWNLGEMRKITGQTWRNPDP